MAFLFLVTRNQEIMKSILYLLLLFPFFSSGIVSGQATSVDPAKFFEDSSVLNVTIKTNIINLLRHKQKAGMKFPAKISFMLPDSTLVNEPITIETRGHFRKDFCYIPPLKIIFKDKKKSVLEPLGSLKLVNQCMTSEVYRQYLVSEWLVYKMYNLLTDKSYRVRLLNLQIIDTTERKKPIIENAFLVEKTSDLAKRNDCIELKIKRIENNMTNRQQMTLVGIFEYMIGNTDWAVSVSHNSRLLRSKNDPQSLPYPVPYDFDYSGLVNTSYAIPDPELGIANVRERLYRGFPRTLHEINETLDIFKKQEKNIDALITNCSLITSRTKKDLTSYLNDFFTLIKDPAQVNQTFVRNARKY